MTQKNETLILALSLLTTISLIGGGFWWFTRKSNVDLDQIISSQSSNSSSSNQNQTQNTSEDSQGATFTAVQNVPTGLFNYGGSTSWAPIRLAIDPVLQAARPEFRLRYVQPSNATPGSGTGIQSLIDGQLTFAQSSRPILDQELNRAQQRGFKLSQIPVAIDGLAVAVNPNLNISGLTIDQLKSIYTGKINNWNQVGGPNLSIKPYSRRISDGGTVELFVQDILGGQAFSPQVEFISTTTQALKKVADSPGGIYYASAPEVVPQCSIKPLPLGLMPGQYIAPYQEPFVLPNECPDKRNQLNIKAFQSGKYPITRNLFVVVKQTGQTEEQAGVAYANLLLTEQGQELITQAGFVKIR
ncbi:PstS family phosphate ABC transporter substrate-binding protein [Anabaena cylindrica FACHB-243]|uniref:Phosphate ABC transporter substrate-binding protein, PhoT family n=1 Tax=Anabaena cylindrica (strain ATCC 27899 / PCC 7122) TaxID=272123 RepID=K9ZIS4_ANACC|nr:MULTISPECIES: PstS family phosphate ABC transporter substrate-binding protein [Anabaena]AFZ58220.1 phosphate ABC transporter substrate-binding protein, PhoT family [Anabaena cylindrica PCC 7122]MBD2419868.1 PstS family phosphate ABC transporter substrate-binding protein [Anabaena cylindrica FACHB-243]MBY5280994.1 PstS family phosphate ABC transporter substrate-binding protein [Anabaena sp. CCAP 1446/1C]MBY5307355.1 PstS family phosphate ABC transporter substrate-binding protein [Anabaena sp.